MFGFRMLVVCAFVSSLLAQSPKVTAPKAAEKDWLIVPGVRVGPLTGKTSEADLARIFGAANVTRKNIYLGEGEEEPGTVVYPADPNQLLEILWRDATRQQPANVRICAYQAPKCRWHTAQGATLNTDLKTLEQHNGRGFTMAGFGWDYSGTVLSWNGGNLDVPMGRFLVRLDAPRANLSDDEYNSVMGDRDFPSSNPVMRKLNPRIYQIILFFGGG